MIKHSSANTQAHVNGTRRHRGSVACRRCRRLRVKCIHTSSEPPCEACKAAGPANANECYFPKRGEAGVDRDWRSRQRSKNPSMSEPRNGLEGPRREGDPTVNQDVQNLSAEEERNNLPHQHHLQMPNRDEIIESCRVFMTSYFQLGFIPKATFPERITTNDVSEFLILCILCLSARFTPCLIAKYGNESKATEFFSQKALEMVPQKMYRPTLENTQGFFLLAIAEWGNNDRDLSSIHMGLAVRMATMLRLHREETYDLGPNATEEEIIQAEMGRRTFWMIQSQDNLHSGYHSPAPFSLEDITALLPSEESDFLFGVIPSERAALAGTVPAMTDPSLVNSPRRSLFASLIQAHSLWGQVARRACAPSSITSVRIVSPVSTNPDYKHIVQALQAFEDRLPQQQKWSKRSLKVWKDLGFDLAYLSVVMMLRLSNIIIRRMYLDDIKSTLTDSTVDSSVRDFWQNVSSELFHNVEELYEQIDSSFTTRSRKERQAYPAILVLPVYVCGSLALNLWKCPDLYPGLATRAGDMLTRCLHLIAELQSAWPMARHWQQGLQQAATPLSGGPSPVSMTAYPAMPTTNSSTLRPEVRQLNSPTQSNTSTSTLNHFSDYSDRIPPSRSHLDPRLEIETLPNDIFDAEVTAFLQGEAHFGFWEAYN